MTWSEVAFAVSAALLLALWWVWVAASRLDRLHRKVATSRAALDNQLLRRASAAVELASTGLLDPVSSVLVGEAAWAALSAGGHGRAELLAALPGLADDDGAAVVAGPGPAWDRPWDDDVDHGEQVELVARGDRARDADRDLAESDLSRTLRVALSDADELADLRRDPLGAEVVGAVAAAWYRVQLARRFHNEAVAQTQRMRRKVLVRLVRLHGRAPMPHTVEIDDAWPEALPRPGEVR